MSRRFTRHPLPIVLFAVFIDLMGFGVLIPVLPQLLANPSSPFYLLPPSAPASEGYLLLGLLLASFPFAQFFFAPILGQASDVVGRRKMLLLSIAGTSVSYLMFGFGIVTRRIWLLFAARLLDGVTGGNVSVSQAVVADVTPPPLRARNFGLIGAAVGLGVIFGPLLGGWLSDPALVPWFNATTPFWLAVLLSAANIAWVYARLPETVHAKTHGWKVRWNESLHHLRKAWSLRGLRPLFATMLTFNTGLSFFITFMGVFLVARFGFTENATGDYFAFAGLCIAASQVGLPNFFARRFGERRVLEATLLASGFGVLLVYLFENQTVLWLATPVFASLIGLAQANATSLVSRSVGAGIQGEILGINASVNALSQAVPPVLAGVAAAAIAPDAPILIAAVLLIVAGAAFVFIPNTLRRKGGGVME